VLGNIYFLRDEAVRARDVLERACPLMELLPAAAYSSTDYRVGTSCFDLLKDVYNKMDEKDRPHDVPKRIADLRLPYAHFSTNKQDSGDKLSTRYNTNSAITALRVLFSNFMNHPGNRHQTIEEVRSFMKSLKVCT
jgi:hypothetical protein